ncbi:MAG: hypothetical protein ACTSVI_10625 [Promethearchaeota archaeon]
MSLLRKLHEKKSRAFLITFMVAMVICLSLVPNVRSNSLDHVKRHCSAGDTRDISISINIAEDWYDDNSSIQEVLDLLSTSNINEIRVVIPLESFYNLSSNPAHLVNFVHKLDFLLNYSSYLGIDILAAFKWRYTDEDSTLGIHSSKHLLDGSDGERTVSKSIEDFFLESMQSFFNRYAGLINLKYFELFMMGEFMDYWGYDQDDIVEFSHFTFEIASYIKNIDDQAFILFPITEAFLAAKSLHEDPSSYLEKSIETINFRCSETSSNGNFSELFSGVSFNLMLALGNMRSEINDLIDIIEIIPEAEGLWITNFSVDTRRFFNNPRLKVKNIARDLLFLLSIPVEKVFYHRLIDKHQDVGSSNEMKQSFIDLGLIGFDLELDLRFRVFLLIHDMIKESEPLYSLISIKGIIDSSFMYFARNNWDGSVLLFFWNEVLENVKYMTVYLETNEDPINIEILNLASITSDKILLQENERYFQITVTDSPIILNISNSTLINHVAIMRILPDNLWPMLAPALLVALIGIMVGVLQENKKKELVKQG